MGCEINSIDKVTGNRFVNMYNFNVTKKSGKPGVYNVASRASDVAELKVNVKDEDIKADAVMVVALTPDLRRVVLIRQYRVATGRYIYELPAGLVDDGETYEETACREMKEETGMDLKIRQVLNPAFISTGFSDETCATVFGIADGEPSDKFLQPNEDITVVIADYTEACRILKEELVSVTCQYQLNNLIESYLRY